MSYKVMLTQYNDDKRRIRKDPYFYASNTYEIRAIQQISKKQFQFDAKISGSTFNINYAIVYLTRPTYFYVTDIRVKQNNIYTFTLTLDPLATYQNEIGSLIGICERCGGDTDKDTGKFSGQYNAYFSEPNTFLYGNKTIIQRNIASMGTDNHLIVSTVSNY